MIDLLGAEDEQDKLIVLDYLIIDHVNHHHSLLSSEFKSAISVHDLHSDPVVQSQIQKVVDALQ
jgi:hypothetical protein